MKKILMPLLIAAAVALSACGQDLSGGDWRTTGVVQAAGTISRSGADTDVLVCVHEGDAVFYRDSADQELFGQVVYPMDVQDPWDTFAAIDFADRNGDGNGDVGMTFTDSEGGDVWMVWFWDADTGEYVFQPEESGSTVTAEWLRWEDLAEDCTTWQGEDGGMLALRADEALYTYGMAARVRGICGTSGIDRCCCGTVTVRTCWPAAAAALPCAAWRAAWGSWTA